ncbi:hypothetical protein Drorol1_Dr00011245 [Drosera rotundifolia]
MIFTIGPFAAPPLATPQPNKPTSHPPQTSTTFTFTAPFHLKQLHAQFIKTKTPLTTDPTPWNAYLRSLADARDAKRSISFLQTMLLSGIQPDRFTLSFTLKACIGGFELRAGSVVHGMVLKMGFGQDVFLMNNVMNLYWVCGRDGAARKVFDGMSVRDVVSWNSMVTGLVNAGDVDGGYEVFRAMPVERNVRSWTGMIAGFVRSGRARDAVELFKEMEGEEGLRCNEATVVAVLAACADLGELEIGKRVMKYSDDCGYGRSVRVCNTVIDMYTKCGCLEDARRVFDGMGERTVVTWSAMIIGLAMHGQGEEALGLFEEMARSGMKPNAVTFVGLLFACSHMGLVDRGREFFNSMSRDYGIVPGIKHYGCMVDLYSRAGLLDEAHEFIKNMPMKPHAAAWGALLGGCKVHKNITLAEEAIKHLLELDPRNDGYYVVLSNIYAESRRWEDVARVRKLMKDTGIKKTVALSSVTVDGFTHEFVARDSAHPLTDEIQQGWEKLLPEMERLGYVPNTSVVMLDVDEDEKLKVLFRHSEKRALVYGLLNTPSRTPIRIMKNLRICEDCHAAFKIISTISDREVIVRDRNRFHCFKDGVCSCKDYW